MIIKSHTADATVGGQIVDRDFVQRLLRRSFFRDSARACLVIFDMGSSVCVLVLKCIFRDFAIFMTKHFTG